MKNPILAGLALVASTFGLAACGEEPAPVEAVEGIPGVSASNARLVLPAVKGNPGAVYFDISNAGEDYAAIRAVDVAGAKESMLHESVEQDGQTSMVQLSSVNVTIGETVKFEPGGKHVMAMDLDPELKAGDTTEVTLTFVGGDKLSFPAQVEAPGGGD